MSCHTPKLVERAAKQTFTSAAWTAGVIWRPLVVKVTKWSKTKWRRDEVTWTCSLKLSGDWSGSRVYRQQFETTSSAVSLHRLILLQLSISGNISLEMGPKSLCYLSHERGRPSLNHPRVWSWTCGLLWSAWVLNIFYRQALRCRSVCPDSRPH